jgi:hypothetical protein
MSSLILTGRWSGHYLQQGTERPISADLLEEEGRLSGFMYDGQPDREYAIPEAVAEDMLPPSAEEQIEAQIRELVPDAPAGPIRFVSHLPPNSILQGKRDGFAVYFLKSYQGTSFGGYKVGDHLLGFQKADHCVHYEGQLSQDGLTLEGRWWIDPDPERGTPGTDGLFSLRRTEEGESLSAEATTKGDKQKRPAMSPDEDPDSPFAAFADPNPAPTAADAYLARTRAERRRARAHWRARLLVFLAAVTTSVAVQGVCDWRGLPALGEVFTRTALQASLGGLAGAGLAFLLLMLSAINYRRREAAHYETVNAWITLLPVILTISVSVGVVLGAAWPFVGHLLSARTPAR